ncbi:TfoX/Sxy family protein [Devosia sp. 1635]|uniref:TfoX/Sxy family protein n=1 Tax=Devosia sp. 1635 TaxID=2726066 RepID=UPI001563EFA5|nr:TfoX/Sxy family protein [Devosia sp. 1635]
MARDHELEQRVLDDLGPLPGLSEKAMFGGLVWLLDGHMLCAATGEGLMVRLGRGNDAWALQEPDIAVVVMSGKPMPGWVRAGIGACADEQLWRRLLDAAVTFVGALPPKN